MLSHSKKTQLINLFSVQSDSYEEDRMVNFLMKLAKANGWTVRKDKKKNVYITKGKADIYPCVVSHTDTVHRILPGKVYPTIIEDTLFTIHPKEGQVGCGGDDKCGIWVCLEMLERLDAVKAVFFAAEEVGCVGSSAADMKFFADCAFAIQVDRQGNKDFVIEACGTDLCSDDFALEATDIMTAHGYELCSSGGLTDVVQLAENEVGVSCINLSGGYYKPHTSKEYVSLTDLANVTDMVEKLCRELGAVRWPHTPTYSRWLSYGDGYVRGKGSGYGYDWDSYYEQRYGTWSKKELDKDDVEIWTEMDFDDLQAYHNVDDDTIVEECYYEIDGDYVEIFDGWTGRYKTSFDKFDVEFVKARLPKTYKKLKEEGWKVK